MESDDAVEDGARLPRSHLFTLDLFIPGLQQSGNRDSDIVVCENHDLKFYYNGLITHTEYLPFTNETTVTSIDYDPVHNRLIFIDRYVPRDNTIYSLDLVTFKTQTLFTWSSFISLRFVYDPVTEMLFWFDRLKIYSWSLKNTTSPNVATAGNLLTTSNQYIKDIAVDSCGGFIYWITNEEMARIRFDGSEREVLLEEKIKERRSLAIDPQTQKIYWIDVIDYELFISVTDMNGKNRKTLYSVYHDLRANSLTVSKDSIYWNSVEKQAILQLPKNVTLKPWSSWERERVRYEYPEPTLYASIHNIFYYYKFKIVAAHYTIKEQTQGLTGCEELKNLISNEPSSVSSQNCTDEKCVNFSVQNMCNVTVEGKVICSCEAGYSGDMCDVRTCDGYCLNNGICSLNKENNPVCECTADYRGKRCNVTITKVHGDNTTAKEPQDLNSKVSQAVGVELKRFMKFFSNKVDEYVGNM
ncbi:hypothetical protein PYW08_010464 [Mythimna loreyi]|uniref:Uncharacterized protein n=1 Tax=Mythimna loreyi TaxID=667449 RepID=A0ACC2Q6H9_9NEOP|nr:hypothetical protein PYW08_010464 [Mythimna loreyi]